MKKVVIVYDPIEGLCVPDGLVTSEVNKALEGASNVLDTELNLVISSSDLIDQWRLMRKYGKIDELLIIFNGKEIEVNSKGGMPHWPKGLCDYNVHRLSQLLKP